METGKHRKLLTEGPELGLGFVGKGRCLIIVKQIDAKLQQRNTLTKLRVFRTGLTHHNISKRYAKDVYSQLSLYATTIN